MLKKSLSKSPSNFCSKRKDSLNKNASNFCSKSKDSNVDKGHFSQTNK
jgi:hypothetical protein